MSGDDRATSTHRSRRRGMGGVRRRPQHRRRRRGQRERLDQPRLSPAPRRRLDASSARCRRTAPTSCSSRTTSSSTAAPACWHAPGSAGCSPTIWSATVASSPGTTSTCGPCSTTTCPASTRCRECSRPQQIANLATEIAEFHLACTEIAPLIPSASKTIKSDAIHLLDLLESPFAPRNFELPPEAIAVLWKHTHRFLERLVEVGYDEWPKIPMLIDWNLGNFSVDDRRRRHVPPVQPMGLRLVPHRAAPARLLLPVARVEQHRRPHPVHVRSAHAGRAVVPGVPRAPTAACSR